MTGYLILLLVAAVITAGIYYPPWRRRWIITKPFPAEWLAIIQDKLPFFDKLSAAEQQQMQDNVRLFLAGKRFYGCGGLVITDEIRVTIAAEACLLLLNRHTDVYPRLEHILVYPYAFVIRDHFDNDDGTVSHDEEVMLGESWHYGKVILSWDDVENGIRNFDDGHNVVLHEFSHQLDSENGLADGAPLMQPHSYATWASVLSKEFERLHEDFEHHHQSVMDFYGITNPAEFFAVATETFFEKPAALHREHPELFNVLSQYYAVDPTAWH